MGFAVWIEFYRVVSKVDVQIIFQFLLQFAKLMIV